MKPVKPLSYLLVAAYLITTLLQSLALAQVTANVSDGFPVLEEVPSVNANPFTFRVNASDDGTVEAVVLVYKFENDTDFRQLPMQQDPATGQFSSQLPDADQKNGKVVYYYLATDNEGNTNTEGFVFDPLTRQVSLIELSAESPADSINTSEAEPGIDTTPERKVKAWHVVLGVLAGVAAASSLLDDDDDTASFTVTTPLP